MHRRSPPPDGGAAIDRTICRHWELRCRDLPCRRRWPCGVLPSGVRSRIHFEFTDDELTEADLDAVAGGAQDTLDDMAQMDMLKMQDSMNQQSQLMQMMSNIIKQQNDTSKAIVNNMK